MKYERDSLVRQHCSFQKKRSKWPSNHPMFLLFLGSLFPRAGNHRQSSCDGLLVLHMSASPPNIETRRIFIFSSAFGWQSVSVIPHTLEPCLWCCHLTRRRGIAACNFQCTITTLDYSCIASARNYFFFLNIFSTILSKQLAI